MEVQDSMMSSEVQRDTEPFSWLSQWELARVLQCVPQQQRLRSCVLVNSSWRAAAMQATTEIDVSITPDIHLTRRGQSQQQSLQRWMQAHPSPASISTVLVDYASRSIILQATGELPLPVHLLTGLKHLQLFNLNLAASPSPGSGQQQQATTAGAPLAALTALTHLNVQAQRPNLARLSALTRLQELCVNVGGAEWDAATGWQEARRVEQQLVDGLPHLAGSLTTLQLLSCAGSHQALQQVSYLSRLQRLHFWLTEQVWPQAAALPHSLTALQVNGLQPPPGARYNRATKVEVTLSHASADSVCQLPALQELDLEELNLHTAVLDSLTCLQVLRLANVLLLSAAPGTPELLVLTRLPCLEQLQLEGVHPVRLHIGGPSEHQISDIPRLWAAEDMVRDNSSAMLAAHAAALTASSQLTMLLLADTDMNSWAFLQSLLKQLLASGRVHAGLRELVVNDNRGSNLLLQYADMAQQVVRCFPNLRLLRLLDSCSAAPPAAVQFADGHVAEYSPQWELAQSLECFAALPGLTTVKLHLEGFVTPSLASQLCTSSAAWRALGSLPALRSLSVLIKSGGSGPKLQHPREESLAELLRCSQLTSFDLTWGKELSVIDMLVDMLAPSTETCKIDIHPEVGAPGFRQQLLQLLVRRVCGDMAVPTTADVAAAAPDFFTDRVLEWLGNWGEASMSGDTVAVGEAQQLIRVCRQQVQELLSSRSL